MARPARLVVPGVAVHIVQRGHDRRPCFRAEADYLVYLSLLRQLANEARCSVHAYCLMTNHVHLLTTPAQADGCTVLMRELGQRYVPYFNRRYARSGTLWEGRFRSCLVDSASYVLACYRYIELNPVRAGMVRSPRAYRWSSYNGNVGAVDDVLLKGHSEYVALASGDAERHAAYRRFVDGRDDPTFLDAMREATRGGYALIGDELKAQLSASGLLRLEPRKPGPKAQPADGDEPPNLELAL